MKYLADTVAVVRHWSFDWGTYLGPPASFLLTSLLTERRSRFLLVRGIIDMFVFSEHKVSRGAPYAHNHP